MKVTSQKVGGAVSGADAANTTSKANKTNLEQLGETGKSGKPSSAEKVNLSQRVLDMQKIKELATPAGSVDEAKVSRLQKLIDEGKYKVDAEAISDRLVDEHLGIPS